MNRPRGIRTGGPVRPTSYKIVEAVMNILSSKLSGGSFLDCFAGTGRLGFEALSRGCIRVVMIEKNRQLAAKLKAAAQEMEAGDRVSVLTGPVESVLKTLDSPSFTVIYLDPPYNFRRWHHILDIIVRRGLVADGGVLAAEHFHKIAPSHPAMKIVDQRRYGQTAITFFEPHQEREKGAL